MNMTLAQWADNGWLTPHRTSRGEIGNLLSIVERDLKDAESGISADWRFGIAYNAALKLCTILLYTQGYRPSHGSHHYRTITALPLILGEGKKQDAEYLNACRMKRNKAEYDYAGVATDMDADELLEFSKGFKDEVEEWLEQKHPDLA